MSCITLKGEASSPMYVHRKLLTNYPELGLTEMPFLNGFLEVRSQRCIPIDIFFSVVYYQKKKRKIRMNGLRLNIFLVWNFFINTRCCQLMHAATLNISLIWLCFLQKGLQFTLQSIKLSGVPPPTVAQKN